MNGTEEIKRKGKKGLRWYVLCILAVLLLFTGSQDMAYAKTGYTDHAHSWSDAEDCGGCKAKSGYTDCTTCSHTGKVTCDVCDGNGYTYYAGTVSETISGTTYKYKEYTSPCSTCGGQGTGYGQYWTTSYVNGEPDYMVSKPSSYKKGSGSVSCTKCGGDGSRSSKCVRCNGKGTNYKCTNDECTLVNKDYNSTYKYNNWSSEYSGNANGSNWLTADMYNICYQTENTYTIKFDANGGTGTMSSMTSRYYDNEYTLTANAFTKTGQTFLGWSTSKTATTPTYANKAKVSKLSATNGATVTLYAVWGDKAVKVTFDKNDGSGTTLEQVMVYGETGNRFGYNTDGTPKWEQTGQFGSWTRTGYKLLGWAFEASATEKKYSVYSTVTDGWINTNSPEVTLYAVWTPITYTVKYDPNGGSGMMADTTHTYGVTSTISANAFSRKGYTFGGWNVHRASDNKWLFAKSTGASDGWYVEGSQPSTSVSKYVYPDKQSIKAVSAVENDIVTLYAVWIPETYTLTFNANGGTGGPGSLSQTFAAEVSGIGTNLPKRSGYMFLGWYTAIEGGKQIFNRTGDAVNDGTYISDNIWVYAGDVTLYAHWGMESYIVTYDANGGYAAVTELDASCGDEVELSYEAEKTGYIFVGWNTDKDAATGLKSLKMPEQDITLYAIYTIAVSDVANHTYPDYVHVTDDEVYLVVWQKGNIGKSRTYPLAYTDDSGIMVYEYTLSETNISSFVSGMNTYCYQVIAFDNAGNSSVLYEGSSDGSIPDDFPVPEKYVQTVEHYKYDMISGEWIWFQTTSSEPVVSGETFIPLHVTPPMGYKKGSIDAAYVVTGAKTSCAYYEPEEYVLSFDANGGSVTPDSKTIFYGTPYGELPTPYRKGYSPLGWFTEREGGNSITSSMKYETAGNSTLYAHWSINSYPVIYDYWTNGGTSASIESTTVAYGNAVPLSATAAKAGWTFVGWNTDPDATTKLDSLIMGDQGVTLYAIYKKNITATFIDGENRNKRTETVTIYNRAVSCDMPVPAVTGIAGWTSLGWSLGTKADAVCVTSGGTTYEMADNLTFYACYVKDVTLSYDTNGAAQQIDPVTSEQYFNAAGNRRDPVFVIANAPNLAEHSFVSWGEVVNGVFTSSCLPGVTLTVSKDTVLIARWDKIPQIEAYDRYFTLEEAINGEITQDRLLEKVTATDKEDGVLVNGVDVVVDDYDASDFTREGEVTITIQATDSFGNEVEKSITIHIVNTEAKKSNRIRYVRFISAEFFADTSGNLIVPEAGGVEYTSIWRNTETYKTLLERALSNTKSNEEYKTIEYFGTSTQIKVAGSGEWTHMEETWVFTREDIEEVKTFVDDYGYGNIKTPNALQMFLELFSDCRTTE